MVPKEIRERLGLLPGTQVELVEVDGVLEISPSVAVAAFSPWHEFHDVVRAACVEDIVCRQ